MKLSANSKIIFSYLLASFSIGASAHTGAVSSATAGAGSAAVEASESPFGNPASIAFLKGYYFTAGFGAVNQKAVGSAQDLSVSLTDNMKDTVVPTSLSYVQINMRPDRGENTLQREFRLGFGNLIRPNLGFGLGVTHRDDRLNYDSHAQTNLDIGFLLNPAKDVGIAAYFENILPPKSEIPEAYRLNQTTTLAGSYNYRRFLRVKADLISETNNSFNKPTLAAGIESYMNKWLILRWGLQRNNEKAADVYAAGMGFMGPKFALSYAYQNSPQDESLTRHSVDLAVPIW